MKRDEFEVRDLVLVGKGKPFLALPGMFVRLASGGPVGVVTRTFPDPATGDEVEVRWLNAHAQRCRLPDGCLVSAVTP